MKNEKYGFHIAYFVIKLFYIYSIMILFFYGEETYQSYQSVMQLKKKFIEKNVTGGGLIEFDCECECDIDKIRVSFGEQNLFAQKKLIIIKNFFANTLAPQQKKIIEKLNSNIQDVIVFWEKGTMRKNAPLYKWLNKNAQTVKENKLLKGLSLEKWIVAEVQSNNKTINSDATKELISFIGNDLWQLKQEIEKLICYVGQNEITVQDVHKIVHGRIQADIFEMVEAIVLNNKEIALKLLKKQIVAGSDVYHIFSMYVYQVRIMIKIGSLINDGITDKVTIAKITKIHPFVVQKTINMVQKISYKKIIQMHKKLTMFDYDIKSGNIDIKTALDCFVTM